MKQALLHPALDGPVAYLDRQPLAPLLAALPEAGQASSTSRRAGPAACRSASALSIASWLSRKGVLVPRPGGCRMSDISAWLTGEQPLADRAPLRGERRRFRHADGADRGATSRNWVSPSACGSGCLAALKGGQAAAPAAEEEQRRQLTVLFCDIVGYTLLAGKLDPEVLTGIVHAYEDLCAACVSRYEGYVFQRQGDGIVAFFGYPLAHEREAERAIRAGTRHSRGGRSRCPIRSRCASASPRASSSSPRAGARRWARRSTSPPACSRWPSREPSPSVPRCRSLPGPPSATGRLAKWTSRASLKPIPVYRVEGQETGAAFRAGGAWRLTHRPRWRAWQPHQRLEAGVQHGAGACGGHQRRAGNRQEPHRGRSLRLRRDT